MSILDHAPVFRSYLEQVQDGLLHDVDQMHEPLVLSVELVDGPRRVFCHVPGVGDRRADNVDRLAHFEVLFEHGMLTLGRDALQVQYHGQMLGLFRVLLREKHQISELLIELVTEEAHLEVVLNNASLHLVEDLVVLPQTVVALHFESNYLSALHDEICQE